MLRPSLNDVMISAVLPVYNESGVLRQLFGRVRDAIEKSGARQEIVFVDDGSTDGSAEMLDGLAADHPQVRVMHLSRNFGHQAAVQAGLAHAQGDVILLMDSDMQDAPEALPRFLLQWQAGYDVVYALRRDRPEALWKRLLFSSFHRMLAAVADTGIPAGAGNFSLIDARVADEIVRLGERDRYLPGLRSWVGFRQIGIEVRRLPRYDNNPRVSLRRLVAIGQDGGLFVLDVPAVHVLADRLLGPGRVLGARARFRSSADCLPTWRFRAGRRRCWWPASSEHSTPWASACWANTWRGSTTRCAAARCTW